MSEFDIRPYPRKPLTGSTLKPAATPVPSAEPPSSKTRRVHTTHAQIAVWEHLTSILCDGARVVSAIEIAAATGLLKDTALYQIKALEQRGAIRRVKRHKRGFELELLQPYKDEP